MHSFEVGLVNSARKAIGERGVTPLAFLRQHPHATFIDLAKECGASALGILLAAYHEAQERGVIRDCARDSLYRKILLEFPSGWVTGDEIGPLFKIGSWSYNFGLVAPQEKNKTVEIIRALTQHSPPPDGWRPASKDDPRLKHLFDQYWPVDQS